MWAEETIERMFDQNHLIPGRVCYINLKKLLNVIYKYKGTITYNEFLGDKTKALDVSKSFFAFH